MKHSRNLRIIAAGGGAPNKSSAPALIEAVEMTGERKPRVLIIPTAKVTNEAYDNAVNATRDLYSARLGLDTTILHEFGVEPTKDRIDHEIGNADVVYIPGGDTAHMMETWHRTGITAILGRAALEGSVVLSGISAGAIAPFAWGHSDSLSYRPETSETWDYIPVEGMGLVRAAITPHFNTTNDRLGARSDSFHSMFYDLSGSPTNPQIGFGIDNFAAIKIIDGKITPIHSRPDHEITVLRKSGESIIKDTLSKDDPIYLHEL